MAWRKWLLEIRHWHCLKNTRQDLLAVDELILRDLGIAATQIDDVAIALTDKRFAQKHETADAADCWAPASPAYSAH